MPAEMPQAGSGPVSRHSDPNLQLNCLASFMKDCCQSQTSIELQWQLSSVLSAAGLSDRPYVILFL
jgi:hypothetical protein